MIRLVSWVIKDACSALVLRAASRLGRSDGRRSGKRHPEAVESVQVGDKGSGQVAQYIYMRQL